MSELITLSRPTQLGSLTGMRFVAAMRVFGSHYPPPGVPDSFQTFFKSGYSGVTFFFVLSGFVITHAYFDKMQKLSVLAVWDYALARIARVYPLYFFCIIYAWLFSGSSSSLAVYLLALQAWSPDIFVAFGLDGPSWSISVEFFIYASFVPLFYIARINNVFSNQRIMRVVVAVTIGTMLLLAIWFSITGRSSLPSTNPASAHRWLYRTPWTRLPDFILGAMAAIFAERNAKRPNHKRIRVPSLVQYISIVIIGLLMNSQFVYQSSFSWDVAYAIPFVLIISSLSMSRSSSLEKLLSSRLMVFLGKSSFAFYLMHTLMLPMYPQSASLIGKQLCYCSFLIVVIAMSIGLHKGYEEPLRRVLREFFEFSRLQSFVRRTAIGSKVV